jgi:hypothetical protein
MIIPFKKIRSDIKGGLKNLTEDGFRKIFEQIDQLGIKKGVDKMGIEKFINQCAYLAAGSGVIAGSGGLITMAIGMPLDLINLITQQFRVTLAINYHNRGTTKIDFHEFIAIVAKSLKVDAGVTLTKTMMEGIAEKLMINLGSKTAERLVPVVGAAIGGTANYLFIKRMARSVKEMHEPVTVINI